MRTKELMLYKHMEDGQILTDMTFLMENYDNDSYNLLNGGLLCIKI